MHLHVVFASSWCYNCVANKYTLRNYIIYVFSSSSSRVNSGLGRLLRACACSGSIGLVHDACLQRWLTSSRQKKCNVCQVKYEYDKSKYKPVKQWTRPTFDLKV